MSIVVIGSLNTDMVTRTSRVPEAGETLLASSFEVGWGGKGGNQAVAAAKLRRSNPMARNVDAGEKGEVIQVKMVGAVGDDVFGRQLLKSMGDHGVDVNGVRILSGESTGTAVILVEDKTGENRILFTPGANFALKVDDDLVVDDDYGDVAIFQLEIPLKVVVHHIKKAKASGARVILNPAPAKKLPDSLFPEIAYLILNETEAAILSGLPRDAVSASSDLDSIASEFINKGAANVIITLGADGVFYQTRIRFDREKPGLRLPAARAKVIDTTAAGDTFVGAFAVNMVSKLSKNAKIGECSLEEDDLIDESIAFAIRAAGKTVEKAGAQKSIPYFDDVPKV